MANFKLITGIVMVHLLVSVCHAQDANEHSFSLNFNYHYGFIIAHRPLVVPLQQNKINGFEFSVAKKSDGTKTWHKVYGYPDMGISFSLWDLGNRKNLGYSMALVPFLDFPLLNRKPVSFKLKFGWGIGYIEKPFDADNNYKNVAIGSKINCALLIQPHVDFRIGNRIVLGGGISLGHYSNGSVVVPNLGINLVNVSAGLSWGIGRMSTRVSPTLPEFIPTSRYAVFGSISTKQVYPANGKNYFAATLSGEQMWQFSRKSSLGLGPDLFFDSSIHKKLEERGKSSDHSFEPLSAGLHAGYELSISDLSIVVNMGAYLYSRIHDETFYHRLGLRYQLNEKMFACLNIKAHWAKADFIELGIGFRKTHTKKSS